MYADDDTAAQKLMDVEDNVARQVHEFLDTQHLAPESPLFQEYSNWSNLISNFDRELISNEGIVLIYLDRTSIHSSQSHHSATFLPKQNPRRGAQPGFT